jgi:hypothetical protein
MNISWTVETATSESVFRGGDPSEERARRLFAKFMAERTPAKLYRVERDETGNEVSRVEIMDFSPKTNATPRGEQLDLEVHEL